MPTIASPTRATSPQGVPEEPNAPPPAATTQKALSVTATAKSPLDLVLLTTTEKCTPCNIPARGWTPEMMTQNEHIELKLLNAKIEQDKIKNQPREQELQAQQATLRSVDQKQPFFNR